MQQQTERQKPMSRIRLNQEYRNKIANRMRVHLEQENTQEKEKFFQERESFLDKQNATWELAKECVSRQYPKDDVKMAHYLQDKYPNVNTIAKDSCFHFGYMKKKDGHEPYGDGEYGGDENRHSDNTHEDDKYVTKHFDFRLNGDIDGVDRQDNESYSPNSRDFAYAYFRDELKAKDNCNPDINIEMEGKDRNPHQQKFNDANEKALGFSGGKGNEISHARDWNANYELDLIGREYCRDRQIPVSESEFNTFVIWQQAKGQLIMAHYKWIKSVMDQINKVVKPCLKAWKYLDEAIEFAKESGLDLNDAEIIRTNSTGLALYNPKNAAQMMKDMKNKSKTREEKILARVKYNKEHKTV